MDGEIDENAASSDTIAGVPVFFTDEPADGVVGVVVEVLSTSQSENEQNTDDNLEIEHNTNDNPENESIENVEVNNSGIEIINVEDQSSEVQSVSLEDASDEATNSSNENNEELPIEVSDNESDNGQAEEEVEEEEAEVDEEEAEVEENPAKKAKMDESSFTEEDNGSRCSVCLENCRSDSEHKLCVIRCGHYFGKSCLLEWLGRKRRQQCPVCRRFFYKNQIRTLFINRVIAMDNSKKFALERKINDLNLQASCMRVQVQNLLQAKLQFTFQIELLKKKMNNMVEEYNISLESKLKPVMNIKHHHNFLVNGQCRVMAYNKSENRLALSTQETNSMFGEVFGLKQITVSNNRLFSFSKLHAKAIKDVKYHPENPWVVTVSQDKTASILKINDTVPFAKLTCKMPIWSCSWDTRNSNYLFMGAQQGHLYVYDLRQPCEPCKTFKMASDYAPIIGIEKFDNDTGYNLACSSLNSVYMIKTQEETIQEPLKVTVDGPIVSLSAPDEKHMLISARPNTKNPSARHIVLDLDLSNEIPYTVNFTLQRGNLSRMSRSTMFFNDGTYYISAYNELNKAVELFDVSNRENVCSVKCEESVLEVMHVQSQFARYLTCLSDTKVNFYKFL